MIAITYILCSNIAQHGIGCYPVLYITLHERSGCDPSLGQGMGVRLLASPMLPGQDRDKETLGFDGLTASIPSESSYLVIKELGPKARIDKFLNGKVSGPSGI